MELQGKTVVVTGASSGIGASLAAAFRDRGCRLVLIARSREHLLTVAYPDDLVLDADLSIAAERKRVVETIVRERGPVHVLVNNAGAGLYGEVQTIPLAAARALFEINFFAPMELCQLTVPHMPPGSMVVNISSIGGKLILPWATLYSATKYALDALSDGLRIELYPRGIRVMGVYPGHIHTEFQQHVIYGRAPGKLAPRRNPFTIAPQECARAVVRGVEREAKVLVVPAIYWFAVWASRLFPRSLERRMRQFTRNADS